MIHEFISDGGVRLSYMDCENVTDVHVGDVVQLITVRDELSY